MKRALIFFITLIFLAGCDRAPRLIVDKSAGFSFKIPGKPREKQMTSDAYAYWVKSGDHLYLVAYWDGDEPSFFEFRIPVLDLTQHHEKSSRSLELQGLGGQEEKIRLVESEMINISRDYYEGNRTFRIQVIYKDDQKHWMDPVEFLDSFRFIVEGEEEPQP